MPSSSGKRTRPPWVVVLQIAATSACAFVLLAALSPPVRVGDGSEYYSMYLAWRSAGRPYVTETSREQYRRLEQDGSIAALAPDAWLHAARPGLGKGATRDFHHFWLYGAMAATIGEASEALGADVAPHTAFLILHWVSFSAVAIVAALAFGAAGLVAVTLLFVLSPALWFADKAHTEFLTVALGFLSVFAASKGRFVTAAVPLAVASAQNPSFAAVAGASVLLDAADRRSLRYSPGELLQLALVAGFTLLHPSYYVWRYGYLTPQLSTGAAHVGQHFSRAPVWLLDPDIGLLPNWPLGVVLLLWGCWLARSRSRPDPGPSPAGRGAVLRLSTFVAAYVVISLLAQSSTDNVNSGGTPGLSRYGLWYVPLFFPLALGAVRWASATGRRSAVAAALSVLLVLHAWAAYRPTLTEGHVQPSQLSRLVQTHASRLYDPPPEVFRERYGGEGEVLPSHRPFAVVGPDCDKVLVAPAHRDGGVRNAYSCPLDEGVRRRLGRLADAISTAPGQEHYVRLSEPTPSPTE